jgi:hypothetical protein
VHGAAGANAARAVLAADRRRGGVLGAAARSVRLAAARR